MPAYRANGARLGWLLLPHEQAVDVWQAGAPPRRLERLQVVEATPEFSGAIPPAGRNLRGLTARPIRSALHQGATPPGCLASSTRRLTRCTSRLARGWLWRM